MEDHALELQMEDIRDLPEHWHDVAVESMIAGIDHWNKPIHDNLEIVQNCIVTATGDFDPDDEDMISFSGKCIRAGAKIKSYAVHVKNTIGDKLTSHHANEVEKEIIGVLDEYMDYGAVTVAAHACDELWGW